MKSARFVDDGGFCPRQYAVASHVEGSVDRVTHARYRWIVLPRYGIGHSRARAGREHVDRLCAAGFVVCWSPPFLVRARQLHPEPVAGPLHRVPRAATLHHRAGAPGYRGKHLPQSRAVLQIEIETGCHHDGSQREILPAFHSTQECIPDVL